MVQLSVDDQAIRKFSSFFVPFVEEQIVTYYNPDFLINFSSTSYSFSFLQNEIIICFLKGVRISDIKRLEYKEFIPDSFLTNLLNNDNIPSRLKRYRRIGTNRLRLELADELRLGGIFARETTAIWDNYQLKIRISSALQMEQIEI
ncbi:hypothetical protein G8761_11875 [Bacillus sp. C11]|nr:hypothetical protein [Neobacillus terrae]NHM31288.1 hypothetical protein [Neobacillus terrae]